MILAILTWLFLSSLCCVALLAETDLVCYYTAILVLTFCLAATNPLVWILLAEGALIRKARKCRRFSGWARIKGF